MFDRLKQLFDDIKTPETASAFDADDVHVAVAALLVHMIGVDGVMDESERQTIRLSLMQHYHLDASQVDELINEATQREQEAVDLYGFTSLIKAHLNEEQRRHVIEMLWEAVYADGEVHEFEDNLVWRIAELIGVSSRDRMLIKRAVANTHADDN